MATQQHFPKFTAHPSWSPSAARFRKAASTRAGSSSRVLLSPVQRRHPQLPPLRPKIQRIKRERGDTKLATPQSRVITTACACLCPWTATTSWAGHSKKYQITNFRGSLFQTLIAEKPVCGLKQISQPFCICGFFFLIFIILI